MSVNVFRPVKLFMEENRPEIMSFANQVRL